MNLRVVTDPEAEQLVKKLVEALKSKLLLKFVISLPKGVGVTVFLHVRVPGDKTVAWSSRSCGTDMQAQHVALLDACDLIQKGTFK